MGEPLTARLNIQDSLGRSETKPTIDRFINTFGDPISGQDSDSRYLNWFLDEGKLDETLSVIDSLADDLSDKYGRQLVYVLIKANRPLLCDATGAVLPNQGADEYLQVEGEPDRFLGESYFEAELGKKNFFYAFLSLPFEEANAEFADYAEFLRANFPCAMSRSSWKTWRLTKSGKSYVGRKMKPDW